MKKQDWMYGENGDELAVLITSKFYARVWYNGKEFMYQVFDKHNFNEYCLGRECKYVIGGSKPTHDECRAECERVVLA
jgi:hypothetical protein